MVFLLSPVSIPETHGRERFRRLAPRCILCEQSGEPSPHLAVIRLAASCDLDQSKCNPGPSGEEGEKLDFARAPVQRERHASIAFALVPFLKEVREFQGLRRGPAGPPWALPFAWKQ